MLITLPNAFGDATQNMAVDAALLDNLTSNTALFRHYAWTEPAITFGYTQKWEAVKTLFSNELQFCRRITGGGIVDHRNDWTYSVLLSRDLPAGNYPPTQTYLELHQAILEILRQSKIQCHLAPCPRDCESSPSENIATASQCFIEASANDVLCADGSKIAGAALKRTREALLIQGSINRHSLPLTFDFSQFQERLIARLSDAWDLPISEPEDLRPFFQTERIAREKERFRDSQWLQKR